MPTSPKATIAVIGGTGLENIEGMTNVRIVNIDTPFGKPSDAITNLLLVPFAPILSHSEKTVDLSPR